jgi:hypothetical protein
MADYQFNPNIEQWKAIPGCPGYEVSDHGRVRSFKIGSKSGKLADHPHIINPQNQNGHHLKVNLIFNGKSHPKSVHRIVIETFDKPCPAGFECCHNDGNPKNNLITNLRWDTPQNNSNDKKIHGTIYRNSVMCRCETCHKIFCEPASHSWRKFCSHSCYIIAEQVWGTCAVTNCSKPVKPGGKSYCNAHYLRFVRYGHPLSSKRTPRNGP